MITITRSQRVFTLALLAIALGTIPVLSADRPDWAYQTPDAVQPGPKGAPDRLVHLPGSEKSFTQAQLNNLLDPPDWFPDQHPPMPPAVRQGHGEALACSVCHLTSGLGHPESAGLAGMPAAYLTRQMQDFRSGARQESTRMGAIAKAVSPEDDAAVSAYFASLSVRRWYRVVETDSVPKTYVNRGHLRVPLPDGGTEPLGRRIVELPEDAARAVLRDPNSSFVSFVPKGSIERGRVLALEGGCAGCHGSGLKGIGEVPRLANASALYTARQLYGFQSGERNGAKAAAMKPVTAKLSDDDIIALSAYLASLDP